MIKDTIRVWQFALIGMIATGTAAWLIVIEPNSVAASAPVAWSTSKTHKIVVLVDTDDLQVMKHAISYSFNATRYYDAKSERITIEIVANGTGIKLFRADVSPLQDVLKTLYVSVPGIVFSVCASSKMIAEQNEGHPIAILGSARLVPFGIGRLIDLEEAGWTYVHA